MAHWQAYASNAELTSGTEVLVTGGHEPVRIRTGDLFSIETPDRNRLSAVVVDRTSAALTMFVSGRQIVSLQPASGAKDSPELELSDGFSREDWTIQ
jgi:hypothetical protein